MAGLDDFRRLAEFSAPILTLDDDSILQECVERAAVLAEAPMAFVSLVMKKVLLFRAAVGLPAELQATRATSRGHSLCQFVVKTEAPFIVANVARDARVPPHVGDERSIVAYAGVPVRVGGQILGSLCVADRVARDWRSEQVAELGSLAERVSQRLETLVELAKNTDDLTAMPPRSLAARAARLAQVVQRSMAEVGPMVRLARGVTAGMSPEGLMRAGHLLDEANGFYEEMLDAVVELCVATKRVEESVIVQAGATALGA